MPAAPWLGQWWNGMVAPLLALKPSAVVWHQGEENSEEGIEYTCLFNAMVVDWRKRFEAPELPFVFVQLRECALSPVLPPRPPGPCCVLSPSPMLCFILLPPSATSHVPPLQTATSGNETPEAVKHSHRKHGKSEKVATW